jgi:hypothetical protein
MNNLAQLIDERRELAAKLAGKEMEIAIALGDRDGARRAMKEMNAQTIARQAAKASGCFFVEQGDEDRKILAAA